MDTEQQTEQQKAQLVESFQRLGLTLEDALVAAESDHEALAEELGFRPKVEICKTCGQEIKTDFAKIKA